MQHLTLNGFHIGYMTENSKVYVQADDAARYFGYKPQGKRVTTLYQSYGIGTIPKHIKYAENGVQTFWFDKHGIKEFAQKSKKDKYIVAAKISDLVKEIEKMQLELIPAKAPKRAEKAPANKKPRRNGSTIQGKRDLLSNKVKIVALNVRDDKVVATFEDGCYATCPVDSAAKRKDTKHESLVCNFTGKTLKDDDVVYSFKKQKKGYGTYVFLKDAVEGIETKGLLSKIVAWFKRK